MKIRAIVVRAAAAAAFVFVAGKTVDGVVLTEKSPEQKQRKDIGKQSSKSVLCMAKGLLKCEANGTDASAECNAADPASSTIPDPDNKIIPKLTADLARCESKLAYSKKSATDSTVNDYTAIGCPGDADDLTAGDQPFADLAVFQVSVGPAAREQLDTLAGIVAAMCVDNECAVTQGFIAMSYAKGLYKCIERCENDYKDSKGNGGGDDLTTKCSPSGGDANFTDCASNALEKAQKKGPLDLTLKNALESAIGDASNDLYNENDCP